MFSDTDFWALVAMVTPLKLTDDLGATAKDEDLAALSDALMKLPPDQGLAFYHMFSTKLHALDTPEHYEHCLVDGDATSSDVFLYARCNVLALGQSAYEEVLKDPQSFPPDMWFEDILWPANKLYDALWQQDSNAKACPSYESFSNKAWENK